MAEARRICGLTITESAALIGVAQADLKRIEFSTGIFKLPLWVIKRATEIYSVPFDYLCGLIDDFDLADPEVFHGRNFFAALQRQEYENFAKLAAEQIRQNDQLKALSSSVCSAIVAQQYVSEVLAGFIRLNQGFNDMPGGARVLRQVKMAENLTQQATAALAKYRCLPEIPVEQAEIISKIFPNNITNFFD
ncbi:MAG: hypothetical protein Q7T96_19900 [Methylobacter sp.]|nr:hypothetical protein [Methylobacter sp.]